MRHKLSARLGRANRRHFKLCINLNKNKLVRMSRDVRNAIRLLKNANWSTAGFGNHLNCQTQFKCKCLKWITIGHC